MRSRKRSRKIVHNNIEYRWIVRGDDGYIRFSIWPATKTGPSIAGSVSYGETLREFELQNGGIGYVSNGDQIVITNRMIRAILDYSCENEGYDPTKDGPNVCLRNTDNKIDWTNALRAGDV